MKKISKPKIRGETWLSDLTSYGIVYLQDKTKISELIIRKNILVCTRCSGIKSGILGEKNLPKNFYTSKLHLNFYRWCESNKLSYAILSDKYGLFLDYEKREFYDLHPSSLLDKDFIVLADGIKNKMAKCGWDSFLFYNRSPVMSIPYFYMMLLTGLKIFFITKLPCLIRKGFF